MKQLFEMQVPKIKVIKIDAEKQLVYQIEIENTLQAKYDAIGNDCRLIEVGARFRHNNPLRSYDDVMYVDEESLLKFDSIDAQHEIGIFKLLLPMNQVDNGRYDPHKIIHKFVGNAIIVGTSNDGETESANVSIEKVREKILGFYKSNK